MGEMAWNGFGGTDLQDARLVCSHSFGHFVCGEIIFPEHPPKPWTHRGLVALPGPGLQLFFVWSRPDAG